MLIGLLVAAIAAIVAGVLAVVYGFMLDFSFGNTLILAGAFGVCSGLVVLAQSLVVHELRNLGRKLGPGAAADARHLPATAADSDDNRALPRALGMEPEPEPLPAASGPPWREHVVSRARQQEGAAAAASPPDEVEPAPPPPPKRRNLLFSSTVRKDREPAAADQTPAPAESADAPSAGFEDSRPRAERARMSETAAQRRAARGPSAFAEGRAGAGAPERAVPRVEEPPQEPAVTVIKSGVVDGMAYSLYSDGSIEAQMPEGMMRFASIDELRDHLDQRM